MASYQDYYARYNENTRRFYPQLYKKSPNPFEWIQSASHRDRLRVPPEQTGQVRVSVGPRGGGSPGSRRTCWGDGGQSSESALLILLGPLQASDHVILWVLLFLLPSSISCKSRMMVLAEILSISCFFQDLATGEYRYLHRQYGFKWSLSLFSNILWFRRWKKEREEWNLANGINFSYTSPFMSDNASIVKT